MCCYQVNRVMPVVPEHQLGRSAVRAVHNEAPTPGGSDKKQISAVVWIFLAVGAILVGLIVVLMLIKSAKNGNPFAILGAMQIVEGVSDVVGTAASKVQAS